MEEIKRLKELINSTTQYANCLLHNTKYKDLLNYVINWSDKLNDDFYTLKTKIFWVINDIHDFPKCKTCGKPLKDKNVFRLNEPEIYNYCCSKCRHSNKQVKEHKKQLLMEKYGVDNVFQLESVKQKTKEKCIELYGVDHYSKCQMWKEQVKNTSLKHYGVDHPRKSEEVKEQAKRTCMKKYGTENPFQNKDIQKKCIKSRYEKYGQFQSPDSDKKRRETCLQKYGKEFYTQTNEYKQRVIKTCMKKYGTTNGGSTYESISKARRRYFYDSVFFSSVPEIAYYIWLKDQKINFEYQPKSKVMKYVDCKGVWHNYYPDFWIIDKNEIHEIKGLHHFKNFNKNDVMVWFKHPEKNYIAEAKQKCMKDNNVIVLTNDEYQKYLDYCKQKFLSSSWFKQYKKHE